jgi:UDP-N-acetyl-D-galactosamine dehydrogenase
MSTDLLSRLLARTEKVAVVGLGYVGLPLAVRLAETFDVIAFDINKKRISRLREGIDDTREVDSPRLKAASMEITDDESRLVDARFVIVAVPTPIDDEKRPDLTPLFGATRTVGRNLRSGSIVVFESTVYPGVTEEECAPLLAETSGLVHGVDFKLGYSPERINPGDREHTIDRVVKVVSGEDDETLAVVAGVYEKVTVAGVHRAASLKVAEAAKVIENIQRDLNIALMNELALIFDRMDIDTQQVLEAAGTKWNFLRFQPGLVGGHCIGVDPYYLTTKAERLGYHPAVILAGRRINDDMGRFVAEKTVALLRERGISPQGARIGVLGLTFKENVPDLRNSRVPDIIAALVDAGCVPLTHDPLADPEEALREYGQTLCGEEALTAMDAVIVAVAHDRYREWGPGRLAGCLKNGSGVVVDIKAAFDRSDFAGDVGYWRL